MGSTDRYLRLLLVSHDIVCADSIRETYSSLSYPVAFTYIGDLPLFQQWPCGKLKSLPTVFTVGQSFIYRQLNLVTFPYRVPRFTFLSAKCMHCCLHFIIGNQTLQLNCVICKNCSVKLLPRCIQCPRNQLYRNKSPKPCSSLSEVQTVFLQGARRFVPNEFVFRVLDY